MERKTNHYRVVDENGIEYESVKDACAALGFKKSAACDNIARKGVYHSKNGHTLRVLPYTLVSNDRPTNSIENSEEYKEFLENKEITALPFSTYDFSRESRTEVGERFAIALFSDAHIEETVEPDAVLDLNEYNLKIAEERVGNYFYHLAECLNEDGVEELFFASLGDTITGFLRDENWQENGLTPLEAILAAQSLVYSGLRYLVEETNLKKIHFIGITGNHSRTTKKIQFSNNYKMSYEWLMYKNLERECASARLPIEFHIPNSELFRVTLPDGRIVIFCHGYQVKATGGSTVCGIYPSLNRLAMKWNGTFKQDKIYLGHFHSLTCLPNVAVNGSIISSTAYSVNNGFPHERPMQYYELADTEFGELLTRKIYCDK